MKIPEQSTVGASNRPCADSFASIGAFFVLVNTGGGIPSHTTLHFSGLLSVRDGELS